MSVTIHNNSRYSLAVRGNEFTGIVGRGESIEVPQDVAKIWLSRPTPAAFLLDGLIRVSGLDAVEDIPESSPGHNPKPAAKPATKDKPVHWKTMLQTVSGLDDLDELQDLHAREKRPRILSAIESRMTELQGA